MSQLDLSRKRKRGDKVFKFKVFGARGYPAGSNGSFLDNIRALLEFGQVETNPMPTWSFQLEARRHPLLLFVVEEPVDFSCTHCRYTGTHKSDNPSNYNNLSTNVNSLVVAIAQVGAIT